jgi:OOP family OmpA-OmpF porin
MNYVMTIILTLAVSGCSVHIEEMTAAPTVQQSDLTDSEGDGVINARDLCLNSFTGAQVNNDGCGSDRIEKVRRTLLVNFANNSCLIEPKFLPEIKNLSDFMKEHPSVNLTVEGHTSIRGSKVLNKKLSQNRAQAIKDILVKQFAIDEHRITPIGYGFERLLLEGDDEYIHARNRRIVAELSSEKSFTDMKWTIYSVDEVAE